MNEGWIKLNRSIREWEWYGDCETKAVFLDILLNANYEDSNFRGETIHAGECVIGRKKLAERLKLSEQQVRTALKKLSKTGEISTTKITNKFTIVKVEKWGLYQGCEQDSNQQDNQRVTSKQPTNNQQVTTSKNIRNKEVNNTYSYSYEDEKPWWKILEEERNAI